MTDRVRQVRVQRFPGGAPATETDLVAAEEPLEVRLEGEPLIVTMRTPGDDLDLVAGLLYSEGLVDGPDDLAALAHVDDPASPRGNTVDVLFAAGVPAGRRERARRTLFASSACGVCGVASIDQVMRQVAPISGAELPPHEVLLGLGAKLRGAQQGFGQTGGLHAAGLFDYTGALDVIREDVGRHNAVDKVLGHRLRRDAVPIDDRILLTSGRAGFEIVQKAAVARIPVVAAVGAPSSLAVALAHRVGLVLIGFLRDGRYNRYGGLT